MEDIIRKRALAGDIDALRALTHKMIKKVDIPRQNVAINMVTDAYNNIPHAAVELGNQLLKGSDLFEKETDLALTWMALTNHAQQISTPAASPEEKQEERQHKEPVETKDASPSTLRRLEAQSLIDPFEELNQLIGLDSVKNEIAAQTQRMEFERLRKKSGLPSAGQMAHFIFKGNPGTGKTTVARIFGSILKKIGHLKSGHVIEVSVSDLIGQFVGETPQKMMAALNEAKEGVLFIDEAYALLSSEVGRGDAFGEQAISTLLKFMEDNRNNITIIAAGYPEPMEKFLQSNPGFKSRFSEIVHFEDYTPADLYKIYLNMAESLMYKLSEGVRVNLLTIMQQSPTLYEKNFPNGRFVRNLFEDTLKYMAQRVMTNKNPSRDILSAITEEDLHRAFQEAQKMAETDNGQTSADDSGANYNYQ